jgi:uncharacterized hydrophobic protein (TIGR00271 family)
MPPAHGLRYSQDMKLPSGVLREQIERVLRIQPTAKSHTYLAVFEAAELASFSYWVELILSAGIATLGLVLNSPAVVIGAMLISPLMGPILAAGLALAAADLYLGLKSLVNILLSVAVAVLFSAGLVWLLPFQWPTAEIVARTKPNLLDLGVALLSGLAGSIVVCRGGAGGGVTALPGVAIAVALMPPLCTVGFGVGSGFARGIVSGASLLFLTNLVAITASAFLVFFLVRMDAPDVRRAIDEAILARASQDRLYALLRHTRLARAFGDIGKLHWRIVMLVSLLVVLFVPLRQSLLQLRDEVTSRAAVREAVRLIAPAATVVSQETDFTADRILVRLVVAGEIGPDRIRQAEGFVMRRTGKEVAIQVRRVASEEELALLRARLAAPPRPAETPRDLRSLNKQLLARLEGPLKELWPATGGELLDYELGFSPQGPLVRIRYQSAKPLDQTAGEMLTRALGSRLQTPELRLELDHQRPPRRRR